MDSELHDKRDPRGGHEPPESKVPTRKNVRIGVCDHIGALTGCIVVDKIIRLMGENLLNVGTR